MSKCCFVRRVWRTSSRFFCKRLSYQIQSIKGRDFLNVNDFTVDELRFIMWTALDLKSRFKNYQTHGISETNGLLMSSLLCDCSVKTQVIIEKASQILGLRKCSIVDTKWESAECVDETGRMLSIMSQVVLASSSNEGSLRELAAGAYVPVINMGSPDANPLSAMAHAVTILTHLNRLERVRVAWVGPSDSAVLASLLLMMPKFRTHLHIATENCNSPANLETALKLAASYRSEIHHSSSPKDATYRADAVITTSHTFDGLCITKKIVDEASLKWIFLHDLPRTRNEVTDDVFHHKKNSLVWESADNHAWVLMAVLVNVLTEYSPTIPPPKFFEE